MMLSCERSIFILVELILPTLYTVGSLIDGVHHIVEV